VRRMWTVVGWNGLWQGCSNTVKTPVVTPLQPPRAHVLALTDNPVHKPLQQSARAQHNQPAVNAAATRGGVGRGCARTNDPQQPTWTGAETLNKTATRAWNAQYAVASSRSSL
jgi:Leu/Phe-tRNA-protein transferase